MRNFSEVLGLHNYRALIFIDSSSCIHFVEMVVAYKNGTAIREIPMKEEYGLPMLLMSGFLQTVQTSMKVVIDVYCDDFFHAVD